jgi:hypothetical protein
MHLMHGPDPADVHRTAHSWKVFLPGTYWSASDVNGGGAVRGEDGSFLCLIDWPCAGTLHEVTLGHSCTCCRNWPASLERPRDEGAWTLRGAKVVLPPIYQHVYVGGRYLCLGRVGRSASLFLPEDGLLFLSPAGAMLQVTLGTSMNPDPALEVRLMKIA